MKTVALRLGPVMKYWRELKLGPVSMTLGYSHHYLMLVTVAKARILPLVVGTAAWGELLVLHGEWPVSRGGSWWVLGVVLHVALQRSTGCEVLLTNDWHQHWDCWRGNE